MNMLPVYRILVLGQPGSGKESLCRRLRTKMFVPYDPSAGYDPAEILPITAWNSVVDGHECTIEAMIHTAGELSEYVVRSTLLIIGIHGAVVTYDATSSESFDAVESHVLEIRDLDAERKIKYPEVVLDYPIVVAGTKVDLVGKNGRRKIAGKKLAVRLGLVGFFETSAKSGEMIEEPFTSIVRELRRRERGSSRGDTRADKSGWSTNMKAKLKRLLS